MSGHGWLIGAAGLVILFVSFAAALLPTIEIGGTADVVGAMMLVAGTVETLAGALRRSNMTSSMLPGIATMATGALFLSGRFDDFLAAVQLLIGWLALRAIVLLLIGLEAGRSVRIWIIISAGTDLGLAAMLLAGLSASTFPIALFGPTSDVVHGFAVILAISFVTTAMLLLEIATTEIESDRLAARADRSISQF